MFDLSKKKKPKKKTPSMYKVESLRTNTAYKSIIAKETDIPPFV